MATHDSSATFTDDELEPLLEQPCSNCGGSDWTFYAASVVALAGQRPTKTAELICNYCDHRQDFTRPFS